MAPASKKLEVDLEKEESKIKNTSSPNGAGYSGKFLEFWNIYPRKKGKGVAFLKWKSAIKIASPDKIIEGLKRHLPEWKGKDKSYIPHPATWLHGCRWEDDIETREEDMKRLVAEMEAEDGVD